METESPEQPEGAPDVQQPAPDIPAPGQPDQDVEYQQDTEEPEDGSD